MNSLTVEVKTLNKMVKTLKDNNIKEVSFEFLIGSCFPNALENIKTELRKQYTKGYAEGLKERSNEAQDFCNNNDSVLDSSYL